MTARVAATTDKAVAGGPEASRLPLALTSEELAVVADRYDGALVPMLAPDIQPEAMVVAALVAGRSLLARGLATTDQQGLRLTASAYDRLAPVLLASVTVEVTVNLPGAPRSAHVVCNGDGRVVLLDEREPGVWVASERSTDLVATIRSLIDDDAAEGTLTVERPPGERTTIGWSDAQHPEMDQQIADLLARV
ncbi:MAG: hypothetical protein M3137_17615 [Actinomycetota bacterium]|nr:hypothetical protein [Actinomycetota bacterium]